jgi:hypothetical protein
MKDLGFPKFLLGMAITRDTLSNTIGISQEAYIADVLQEHGFHSCKPVDTPCASRLSVHMCPRSEGEKKTIHREFWKLDYCKAVGQLQWITNTRPDIAFAVGQVARFVHNPGREHFQAVKRIFKYLRGTSTYGLVFARKAGQVGVVLHGHTDSDFAGDPDTHRSTYGYSLSIGHGTFSFRSKRAPTVALSSCEAEYVAACAGAQEAVFFRRLLAELGYPQRNPTVMYEDNQSSISHSRNSDNHSRMKHINVKKYFVRELVRDNVIDHHYVPTGEMLADIFTKPLGRKSFLKFRAMLGVLPF